MKLPHWTCYPIGAVIGLCLVACDEEQAPSPTVETKLDIRIGLYSEILVLPTGERVLLITGSNGLATCCLLPPLAQQKVEK